MDLTLVNYHWKVLLYFYDFASFYRSNLTMTTDYNGW